MRSASPFSHSERPRDSARREIGPAPVLTADFFRWSARSPNPDSRRSGQCRLSRAAFAPEGPAESIADLQASDLGISFVEVADPYQSVNRSLKYVPLFLGLVFLSYFIFEVTSGKRVHPAQYILVGFAQIIFYLLLLSLAERIGFDFGFLTAGAATVILLSVNAGWIFASRAHGLRALVSFQHAVRAHLHAAAA